MGAGDMLFNVSENMTTVVDLIKTANDFSDGFLGFFIILVVGAGLFFVTSAYDTLSAIVASGFVSTFVAIMLSLIGIVHPSVPVIIGAISVFAGIINFVEQN